MDAIVPVFIYFIYWKRNNFNEDESIPISVNSTDIHATVRLILINQQEKAGIFEELIFSGLTYDSEQG